jgi:hypothetical protein
MAYDANVHEIDPKTGFMVHKQIGPSRYRARAIELVDKLKTLKEDEWVDEIEDFLAVEHPGPIVGLENAPLRAVSQPAGEWPKWVKLHDSQIERPEGAPVYSKHWPKVFFNRANGEVTALVHNEEEADRASKELPVAVDHEGAPEPVLMGEGETTEPVHTGFEQAPEPVLVPDSPQYTAPVPPKK